jgi:hypothetical protein
MSVGYYFVSSGAKKHGWPLSHHEDTASLHANRHEGPPLTKASPCCAAVGGPAPPIGGSVYRLSTH